MRSKLHPMGYLMHAEQTCIYGAQSCSADTVSSYLRPSCTFSRHGPTSQKTPMNDVDNYVLLLRRHLVIAWQTEPAPENISSYIDSRALYVSICAASAIALNRNKRVCPIYRLHMHGLPNRTLFRSNSSNRNLIDNTAAELKAYT